MRREWRRADGVSVVWVGRSDLTSSVYLSRPQKGTIISKGFDYWQRFEGTATAEELAALLGLEEVFDAPAAA